MERKHKIYFIISGIAYLLLCFTFKIAYFKLFPSPAYQVYSYLQLLILAIAFIFGIRGSIRGIVIWLGILCGDLILIISVLILIFYGLSFVTIANVFSFGLIISAIVYGFKSLNLNTIASDNFSKMYRKTAIVFLFFSTLFIILIEISRMEYFWYSCSNTSIRILAISHNLLNVIIVTSVVVIAISKIAKRKTFGFVLTAILILWFFFSYMSSFFGGGPFSFISLAIQNDTIKSSPILLLPLKIMMIFGQPMFIFLLLFSLILLINFLFYLKRDSELIPIKNNGVKPFQE